MQRWNGVGEGHGGMQWEGRAALGWVGVDQAQKGVGSVAAGHTESYPRPDLQHRATWTCANYRACTGLSCPGEIDQ